MPEFREVNMPENSASWLDTPISSLDGLTPRQAAQTEEGRQKLAELTQYTKFLSSTIPFTFDDLDRELADK